MALTRQSKWGCQWTHNLSVSLRNSFYFIETVTTLKWEEEKYFIQMGPVR